MDVVVTTCRPRMSEVQKLKREVCSVGRENGGGNEVCQEASASLSRSAPLVDCSLKGKHVLNDRAGHPGNIKERASKLPQGGKRARLEG